MLEHSPPLAKPRSLTRHPLSGTGTPSVWLRLAVALGTAVVLLGTDFSYASGPDKPAAQRIEVTGVKLKKNDKPIGAGLGPPASMTFVSSNPAHNKDRREKEKARSKAQSNSSKGKAKCDGEDAGGTDASTDNPVKLSTGEKSLDQVDRFDGSMEGLSILRGYRSQQNRGSMFGPHWHSNIDLPQIADRSGPCYTPPGTTMCHPLTVTMVQADGKRVMFRQLGVPGGGPAPVAAKLSSVQRRALSLNAEVESAAKSRALGLPTPDVGSMSTLILRVYAAPGGSEAGTLYRVSGGGWTLIRERITYNYNRAAFIQSVINIDGLQTNYERNAANQVSRIINAGGKSLSLTWLNGRVSRIDDQAGNVWSYGYDSVSGMLTTVSLPAHAGEVVTTTTYHYEESDKTLLTGYSVNGERRTRYAYLPDRRARLSQFEDAEERDTFEYGVDDLTLERWTKHTDVRGSVTTYRFKDISGEFRLVNVRRSSTPTCDWAASSQQYDSAGRVSFSSRWGKPNVHSTYDSVGRLVREESANGTLMRRVKINTWDGDDLTETQYKNAVDTPVLAERYRYVREGEGPGVGRLKSVETVDLRTQQVRAVNYEYAVHSNGMLASVVQRHRVDANRTAVTTDRYDTQGNRISHVNSVGHTHTWAGFNAYGQPGTYTDPNGVVTIYTYTGRGQLARSDLQLPAGVRSMAFAYHPDGNPRDVLYPEGSVQRFRYAFSGRVKAIGDREDRFTLFERPDALTVRSASPRLEPEFASGVLSTRAASDFVSIEQQDSLGRPYNLVGNNSQRTEYRYDPDGNRTSQTVVSESGNQVTRHEFLWKVRLNKTILPDNSEIRYGYDADGNLESVTDPRGAVTRYTYNGFGEVMSETNPDSGTKQYGYNLLGNRISETRADGVQVAYGYDLLGRLVSRSASGSTETYVYDEGTYGLGRLTSLTGPQTSTRYRYSAAGELVEMTATVGPTSHTTRWDYDIAGRLKTHAYPATAGLTLRYDHDAGGRVTRVWAERPSGTTVLMDSFQYQPVNGPTIGWRFGNGLPRATRMDADGRANELLGGGAYGLRLGYHDTGLISLLDESSAVPSRTDLSYDNRGRVTQGLRSGDGTSYAWDTNGNRTGSVSAGATMTYTTATGRNRLEATGGSAPRSFTYDVAGNLTQASGATVEGYEYDSFNRFSRYRVNGTAAADYVFNAT